MITNDRKKFILTPVLTYEYKKDNFLIYEEDLEYFISKYIIEDNNYILIDTNDEEIEYGNKILQDYLRKNI